MKIKVKTENITKYYPMYTKKSEILKGLFSIKNKHNNKPYFAALKDISLEAFEGETVGILGLNGSGKSTLSNIIGQIIQPTSGKVFLDGEPSLIAISAGLNNNLNGIENIDLKCMMLGLTKEEISEVKDSIIEFAELGNHIYQPVKNYSSGMKSRLGFAISVHTDPDILIIDEALSVGDSTFAEKSLNKIKEFKKKGKTIFFVSHSANQMKQFCDKILWIHYGKVKAFGNKDEIIEQYQEFTKWYRKLDKKDQREFKNKMLNSQMVNFEDVRPLFEKSEKNRLTTLLVNSLILLPAIVTGVYIGLGL